jgi:hypothetical protein
MEKMKEFHVQINSTSLTIMHKWCLAATQPIHPNQPKSSHLKVSIDAVTTNDISFHLLALSQLNMMLGT